MLKQIVPHTDLEEFGDHWWYLLILQRAYLSILGLLPVVFEVLCSNGAGFRLRQKKSAAQKSQYWHRESIMSAIPFIYHLLNCYNRQVNLQLFPSKTAPLHQTIYFPVVLKASVLDFLLLWFPLPLLTGWPTLHSDTRTAWHSSSTINSTLSSGDLTDFEQVPFSI